MHRLIFLALLFGCTSTGLASSPRLVVPAVADQRWAYPIYSPDGKTMLYTDASLGRIWARAAGEDSARRVVDLSKSGQRFAMDPKTGRVVFRARIQALPDKPQRLVSTSIYLWDPAMLTQNLSGDVYGPYLIKGKVWYRYTLLGPLASTDGEIRTQAPYLDTGTGRMWVVDAKDDTAYATPNQIRVAGIEVSPDGNWVAAVCSEPSPTIIVVSLNDGTDYTIPGSFAPSWSGDSQFLVCVHSSPQGTTELRLIHIPGADTGVILATNEFHPEMPSLSFDASRVLFVNDGAIWEMRLDR
jgi:hypothetical protein